MDAFWACLALPGLPLEAAFRGVDGDAGTDTDAGAAPGARAVFDGPANRPALHALDAAARAAGLRPGQPLAEARVLLPTLLARRRVPEAEAAALERLAAWAYGFSSQVVWSAPDAVLLEAGASLALFGGWPRLARRLREELGALGHAHRLAAAPTPAAAEVLARSGLDVALPGHDAARRALAQVPIALSGLPARTAEALHGMGLRRLGELLRLPRPELGRRIGAAGLAHLERLLGERPDPRDLYRPPERFAAKVEFDHAVEHLAGLQFALQRLTRELAAFVLGRDGGVQHYALAFMHEDHPPTRLEIGLRRPSRDPAELFAFARDRLERVALPGPATALHLLADALPPFVPEGRDLFASAPRGGLDLAGLEERLRARLGDDAVRGLALHPDPRPERAWRATLGAPPAQAGDAPRRGMRAGRPAASPGDAPREVAHDAAPEGAPPRPLWLLPAPIPFRGRIARVLAPPERIEGGWWDGGDVERDYVIAELDTGQRAWLFRAARAGAGANPTSGAASARAPAAAGAEGWMLHGWFA